MQIRRFTRLCNGFSKKLENHKAAVALHFAYYNFCRIHGSLRVTLCDGERLDGSSLAGRGIGHGLAWRAGMVEARSQAQAGESRTAIAF